MAEMIQAGGDTTVKILHHLCNKIYKEEHCPEEWGQAIYKKSIRRECRNYRVINLLSIPSEVFTKALQQRMKKHVERVLAEEQADFPPRKRNNESTVRDRTDF